MGRAEQDDNPDIGRMGRADARVYKPCPACGRAVPLSNMTRVAADPETYECRSCGARFYLTNATP